MKHVKWGKTDKNTLKHWLLGTLLFALIVAANYILTPEQSALLSVFIVAAVWDYQQYKLKNANFDLKDIVATCLTGGLVVIALIIKSQY